MAARYPNNPIMARADEMCGQDRYVRFIRKRALITSEAIIRWAEECLDELRADKEPEGGSL
jgi:hypothetical protein